MRKEVPDVVESCSTEDVLARLTVRLRASYEESIAGSVMLSSGSLQKSEDVVGDMGGDSTVSRLLWEDPLLWGALHMAGGPFQTPQQHASNTTEHASVNTIGWPALHTWLCMPGQWSPAGSFGT